MNIQEEFMKRVQNGESWKVDLKKKNLRIGSDYLVKEGEWDHERELIDEIDLDPIEWIEGMYWIYKNSYPSEREQKYAKKAYFKALMPDEMTDEQIIKGIDRTTARASLESLVLCLSLTRLEWNPEWGSWYYKSKTDPDFILLKEWVD